jgi:hypothetical protein
MPQHILLNNKKIFSGICGISLAVFSFQTKRRFKMPSKSRTSTRNNKPSKASAPSARGSQKKKSAAQGRKSSGSRKDFDMQAQSDDTSMNAQGGFQQAIGKDARGSQGKSMKGDQMNQEAGWEDEDDDNMEMSGSDDESQYAEEDEDEAEETFEAPAPSRAGKNKGKNQAPGKRGNR